MYQMFRGATSFNQDISSWEFNVTDMGSMFEDASSFNQDLSSWNLSSLVDTRDGYGLDNTFDNSNLSTENYNSMLISWATDYPTLGIYLGALGTKYDYGTPATARATLVSGGWTITDSGLVAIPNMTLSKIMPDVATTSDDLIGYCEASEIDGDDLSYYYKWYINNVEVDSGYLSTEFTQGTLVNINDLVSASTSDDDAIIFSCLANDGTYNATSWLNSSIKYVGNGPDIGSPYIDNNVPETNDVIECINGTFVDSDNTLDHWDYVWYDNDVLISGETTSTLNLSLSGLDKGDNITCKISSIDDVSYQSYQEVLNATIQNSLPFAINSYINNYSDRLNGVCNGTSDNDGDTLSYYYEWKKDNVTQYTGLYSVSSEDYSIEDSPGQADYSSNTWDELAWTEFEVTSFGSGTLSSVNVAFTWDTDPWASEGGFRLMSPLGTIGNIHDDYEDGTYSVDMSDFDGESINGTWRIWIDDTYGDGGHQAIGITVTFTSPENIDVYERGNWTFNCLPTDSQDNATSWYESEAVYLDIALADCNGIVSGTCNATTAVNYTDGNKVSMEFTSIPGLEVSVSEILTGDDWVFIDSASALNREAKITFSDANWENIIVNRDGIECSGSYCSNVNHTGTTLSFDVTGFSNYSYTGTNNSAPALSSISLLPNPLSINAQLTGSCIFTDEVNSTIDYYYKWYKNNVEVTSGGPTSANQSSEFTNNYAPVLSLGDNWTFGCYAEDELNQTNGWYNSTTRMVVANAVPVITTYIDTPTYDSSDTMNAYCKATDQNLDNVTLTWRLFNNDLFYSEGSVQADQNVNTKVVSITEEDLTIGNTWYLRCKATDGYDESDYLNSSVETVITYDQPPVFSYLRKYPTSLYNDTDIYVLARATDINSDNLTYCFDLLINDVVQESGCEVEIAGTIVRHNFTYSSLVAGDNVSVNANVTDTLTSSTFYLVNLTDQYDAITVKSINNVPYISSIRTSPNTFIGTDDDIVGYCTGIDVDADELGYNYIWYVNNISVKTGSKTSSGYLQYVSGDEILIDILSSSYTTEMDNISFSCSVFDSENESDYNRTNEMYVFEENNFAPNMETLELIPSGSHDTTQSFTIEANASDRDEQEIRFEWRFVKNGAYQTLQESSWVQESIVLELGTLSSATTLAGDTWYVRARAFDGDVYTGWTSSNPITILNSVPVMTEANIITTPYENITIVGLCSATDADDQSLVFDHKWYKNGVETLTTENLDFSETRAGENWTLSCRVYDSEDYSNWLNSSSVTIIDTASAPYIDYVTLSGQAGLLIGNCEIDDSEGDDINYTFKLYKDGLLINTSTRNDETQGIDQEINFSETVTAGEEWIFSCEGTDIDGSSDFTNSSTLVIPDIAFNYVIASTDETGFQVDWATNADIIKVYLDDDFIIETTLIRWIFEDLNPNTEYEVSLQPIKDGFYGSTRIFNVTTEDTDNNNPTMTEVIITPTIVYTDNAITGYCEGTDIESFNIFYTYKWYVDDVIVDSGYTNLVGRDESILIGSLTSSNYEFNETVKLGCIINDGLGVSDESFANITVLNSEPIIDEVEIVINGSFYNCIHSYEDIDGDSEISQTYKWFNKEIELNETNSYLSITGFDPDDELVCELSSGDIYNSIIINSSTFIVGDFLAPVITDIIIPEAPIYTDSSYLVSAECSDDFNIANGYPILRLVNPNFVEEEYNLYYDGGDDFSRYIIFSIGGEYTELEIDCKDGSGNRIIEKINDTIYSLVRETIVDNGGGSGSSTQEPAENLSYFEITPEFESMTIGLGETKIVEFEILNKGIVDISFTSGILVDDENQETYDWMYFEDDLKAVTFDIAKIGGLSSDNKYLRYYVTVPEDAELGSYNGIIEVNGGEQTEYYSVTFTITESTFNLLSILDFDLFSLPFTSTPTGAVIGGVEETKNIPVKVWYVLTASSVIVLLIFVIRKYVWKVQ